MLTNATRLSLQKDRPLKIVLLWLVLIINLLISLIKHRSDGPNESVVGAVCVGQHSGSWTGLSINCEGPKADPAFHWGTKSKLFRFLLPLDFTCGAANGREAAESGTTDVGPTTPASHIGDPDNRPPGGSHSGPGIGTHTDRARQMRFRLEIEFWSKFLVWLLNGLECTWDNVLSLPASLSSHGTTHLLWRQQLWINSVVGKSV